MISIITPILNESENIKPFLKHLNTLEGDFELILVDGGSTDGTISKINKRLSKYMIKNKINIDDQIVFDSKLIEVIEEIIDDVFSYEFNLKNEQQIIEYIKEITSIDGIDGTVLLTDRGKVIYSSYNIKFKKFFKGGRISCENT